MAEWGTGRNPARLWGSLINLRYDVVRTGNDMGPAAFLSVSLKYSYNEYNGENGE